MCSSDLDDSSIRVRTQKDTSGQVGRVLQYLGDFLGIVSIVALFLSLVGGFYLYLSFLLKKRKTISIYKAMGLPLALIKKGLFFQSALLGMVSFIFSLILSSGINYVGETLLAPYLTTAIKVHLSLPGVVLGLVILIIIYFLIIRPIINQFLTQKAGQLFQENSAWSKKEKTKPLQTFLWLIPVLFILTF